MRLPTYDEIASDNQQRDVYEAPFNESLFVVGPPGSGKTVLAVHRAQMLGSAGTTVVLVTYNRMLRRLIAQLTDNGILATTMHKYVAARYVAQTQAAAPCTEPYVYDWEAMFATLVRVGVQPEPIHVIVDEGQDLPKEFFGYLRNFVATSITVFADQDQALSDERSKLSDIKEAVGFDDPFLLSSNHRNTPEIARVAAYYYAGDIPVAEVMRPASGELPRVVVYHQGDAAERVANWYRARGGRVGVAVVHNETGGALEARLRQQLAGQRVDFYTGNKQNENEIELLDPGVTILNVQSIKGQEFDTVFVLEFEELLLEASEANRRKMYMLCARARDNLVLMYQGDPLPPALAALLPGSDILERP